MRYQHRSAKEQRTMDFFPIIKHNDHERPKNDKQIHKATQSQKSQHISKVINIYFDSSLRHERTDMTSMESIA